jgi:hypothetical protein
MSLVHEFAGDILFFRTSGDVVHQDGLSFLQSTFAAARVAPPASGWHLCFDIRESTENRSSPEIDHIAGVLHANKDILSGKVAILVKSQVYFGVARIFVSLLEPHGFDGWVGYQIKSAEDWFSQKPEAAALQPSLGRF